ncbi:hypothetical protein EDC36_11730 [Tepidimonas ignava]|uniref:Uncharacterized protein n=1 Tax=Tepidimonas ignava TaxID=114249 RepID=A0A4R3L6P0_9BURK|nr:hypothetical protein EDC36_11730 [Tepidimonas ignava]TSE18800.1 hypothetical protein Tigna_02439 [Tepidimonas ignava]
MYAHLGGLSHAHTPHKQLVGLEIPRDICDGGCEEPWRWQGRARRGDGVEPLQRVVAHGYVRGGALCLELLGMHDVVFHAPNVSTASRTGSQPSRS